MSQFSFLRNGDKDLVRKANRHNVCLDPVDHSGSLLGSCGEGSIDDLVEITEVKRIGHLELGCLVIEINVDFLSVYS